jgi:hypothetical protein
MKEMALRKQEMFEAFMSKELGQGKRLQVSGKQRRLLNTRACNSELKDLMSGKTIYRPADLPQDDPDDLDEAAAPTAQVKKPKRRREKKAQEPEPQGQKAGPAPAAPQQEESHVPSAGDWVDAASTSSKLS